MRLLITGGAGFIGVNAAQHFLSQGHDVVIADDLSRWGAKTNLAWLDEAGRPFIFSKTDIRQRSEVLRLFEDEGPFNAILHLAAQVAVTTSVLDPLHDFEVNTLGTLNLLEAARAANPEAVFLYASTNKVYGALEDIAVAEQEGTYQYESLKSGIPETRQLDFHSPYGCSKGAADQYVLDYARIYGLPTVVFRQSCIYGPRQFGVEDQGWVAWFCIAAMLGKPITVYGDGKQVRDVLHIADLIRLYELAIERIDVARGRAFNVGGGPEHQLSLLELLAFLEERLGHIVPYEFADWRPGDQRVYVSDLTRVRQELGWEPEVDYRTGVSTLLEWVQAHKHLFLNR